MSRAADDFETIRARIAELAKECTAADKPTVDVKGETIVNANGKTTGSCGECQRLGILCNGACCN